MSSQTSGAYEQNSESWGPAVAFFVGEKFRPVLIDPAPAWLDGLFAEPAICRPRRGEKLGSHREDCCRMGMSSSFCTAELRIAAHLVVADSATNLYEPSSFEVQPQSSELA